MEAQIQEFNTLKNKFHTQEKIVVEKLAEQEKNKQVLSAFKNELNELLQRTKFKIDSGEQLTADEYVELKQTDTGLKARIEYHQAVDEELENLIQVEKGKLFAIQQEMKSIRAVIFNCEAKSKLKSFISENQALFDELFSLLYLSGKLKPNHEMGLDEAETVLLYLKNRITANISRSPTVPAEFSLSSEVLMNFSPKRPTQLLKEEHQPQKTGFKKLLTNLMGS